MFEPLKFHIWKQMRVLVIQVNHKSDVNLIVFKVVNERTTACISTKRPAHCVGHGAFRVVSGLISQISFMPRPNFGTSLSASNPYLAMTCFDREPRTLR